MTVPTVYIEREPLVAMLCAAVEVYPRECLGLVFGRKSSRRTLRHVITNVLNCAALTRHTTAEVVQSKRAGKRLYAFIDAAERLFPYIGYYHSHTEKTLRWQQFGFSHQDARTMSDADQFGIVLTVHPRTSRRLRWCIRSSHTRLRGSLGAFDFHLTAHALVRDAEGNCEKDDEGNWKTQRLPIAVAPQTLRALNRSL